MAQACKQNRYGLDVSESVFMHWFVSSLGLQSQEGAHRAVSQNWTHPLLPDILARRSEQEVRGCLKRWLQVVNLGRDNDFGETGGRLELNTSSHLAPSRVTNGSN